MFPEQVQCDIQLIKLPKDGPIRLVQLGRIARLCGVQIKLSRTRVTLVATSSPIPFQFSVLLPPHGHFFFFLRETVHELVERMVALNLFRSLSMTADICCTLLP